MEGKAQVLAWCRDIVKGYKGVDLGKDHTSHSWAKPWNDGLAFCAILHAYFPEDFGDFGALDGSTAAGRLHNFKLAFRVGLENGIPDFIDVEDMMDCYPDHLDSKSIFVYVAAMHKRLRSLPNAAVAVTQAAQMAAQAESGEAVRAAEAEAWLLANSKQPAAVPAKVPPEATPTAAAGASPVVSTPAAGTPAGLPVGMPPPPPGMMDRMPSKILPPPTARAGLAQAGLAQAGVAQEEAASTIAPLASPATPITPPPDKPPPPSTPPLSTPPLSTPPPAWDGFFGEHSLEKSKTAAGRIQAVIDPDMPARRRKHAADQPRGLRGGSRGGLRLIHISAPLPSVCTD